MTFSPRLTHESFSAKALICAPLSELLNLKSKLLNVFSFGRPDSFHHIPTSTLTWDENSLAQGKKVHLNKFPNNFHVQLYRITASTRRTDFIVTNDKSQLTTDVIQEVYNIRWCVEEFHREAKQVTGVAKCQCRKQRIQRNHIACAYLVWLKLKSVAYNIGKTIYQIKSNLLEQYMINELKQPQVEFDFA